MFIRLNSVNKEKRVCVIISNYNVTGNSNPIVDKLIEFVKWPTDIIVVNDTCDDTYNDTSKVNDKYTLIKLHDNINIVGGFSAGLNKADEISKSENFNYYAYCFVNVSTCMDMIGTDIIQHLVENLIYNDIVGIHPSLTLDSTGINKHMFKMGSINQTNIGLRKVNFINNIFSMYNSEWFNKVGRFNKKLIYGLGLDIDIGMIAINNNHTVCIDDTISVKINSTFKPDKNAVKEKKLYLNKKYGSKWNIITKKHKNTRLPKVIIPKIKTKNVTVLDIVNPLIINSSNVNPIDSSNITPIDSSNVTPLDLSNDSPNDSPIEPPNVTPLDLSNDLSNITPMDLSIEPFDSSNVTPLDSSNVTPIEPPLDSSNVTPLDSSTEYFDSIKVNDLDNTLLNNNYENLDNYIEYFDCYMNNIINTNKIIKYVDKVEIPIHYKDNSYNKNQIKLSIVIAIQNRSIRGLISCETLIRNTLKSGIEIILVENKSDNMLDTTKLPKCNYFTHHIIDTGSKVWSRSKILNYGIKRASGKYIMAWDVCFLCNKSFINNVLEYIQSIDTGKHLISLSVYESHSHGKHPKGRGYGNLWIYETDKIKSIKGFDENFTSFGMEDRDIEYRYNTNFDLKTLHSVFLNKHLYVIHMSHKRATKERSKSNNINKKKYEDNKNKGLIIVNKTWGDSKTINIKTNFNPKIKLENYYIFKVVSQNIILKRIDTNDDQLNNVIEIDKNTLSIKQNPVSTLSIKQNPVSTIKQNSVSTIKQNSVSTNILKYPRTDGIFILKGVEDGFEWINLKKYNEISIEFSKLYDELLINGIFILFCDKGQFGWMKL